MNEQRRYILSKINYLLMMLPFALRAAPQTLRIDGSLYNFSGAPITGSRDIQIKAFDAATGGSAVWTSSVYNTSVASGRFSIALDATADTTSLTSRIAAKAASGEIWFEIHYDTGTANGTMDADVAVAPRIRGKGTMFALVAAKADALTGVTVTVAEMNYLSGVTSNIQTQITNSSAGVTAKVSKTGDSMSGALEVGSNVTATGTMTGSNLAASAINGTVSVGGAVMLSVGSGVGAENVFVGRSAGLNLTGGGGNTFVGSAAGRNNTTGGVNTFTGFNSAYYNTTGSYNAFYGWQAGYYNVSGNNNAGFGSLAGANSTGDNNSFFGSQAGGATGAANNVTALGFNSGANNSTGGYNTFVGSQTGIATSTQSFNTFIGYGSGDNVGGATRSSALGAYAVVAGSSSVQLGSGTNSTDNSLQFNGYNFLNSSGAATFASVNGVTTLTSAYLNGLTANIQTQLSSASAGGGATYQTTAGSCYSGYTSVDTQTRYMCIQGTSAYTSNSYVSNQACPSAAPTSVGGTAEVSGFWAAQLNTATIRTCRSSATANSCYTTTTGSCDTGFTNVDTITLYSCMTGSSQYTDSVPVESYLSCPSTATTMTGSPSTSGFWSSQLNTTSVKVCCK